MFNLSSGNKFHLYTSATDMRKSFDGLSGLANCYVDRPPQHGEVFAFVNKGRDKLKLLHWQGGGFVLYYKRLEQGTFELPEYDIPGGWIVMDYAWIFR